MLHSTCQQIEKTQKWPQYWKRSVFIPISRKGDAKECLNYYTIMLISHASKVMLKILQDRLQQYVYPKLPGVHARFRKGRGIRDEIADTSWIIRKQGNSRKTSTPVLLILWKPLTVWITTNCGKFWKRWEYQPSLSASWETCLQVKKQQLEPYMEELTSSKLGKEYDKAVYSHPVYLTYLQRTSCEMPGWLVTSWSQDCWEK